jgi:uncharacterized membrane protein YcaP (DUF421 family)
MFFQSWEGIARTIIVGALAYATLVIFLRIAGKRSLAKLNAFDLVVTVALGSILASILLQESIALVEGATAIGILLALQYAVTFASVRSSTFASLVRSEARLLAHNGAFCRQAMRRERMTEEEVLSAIRDSGAREVSEVRFVILEGDGSLSVGLKN